MISDRCELNRQIRSDNRLLGELKKQVAKLTKPIKESIPAIAEALEKQEKITLDKRKIVVDPIKTAGVYTAKCKLGYEITADLKVEVREL